MNSNTAKTATAFTLLVVFGVVTLFVYFQIGLLKTIVLPQTSLDTLPLDLGDWKGEERETNIRLFRATGANEVLSRRYADLAGRELSLHMAVFNKHDDRLPHSPMVCYPSAGWTQVETTAETIDVPDAPPLNLQFAIFEKDGRRSLVAFWYQFGRHSFYDEFGLQKAKLAHRSDATWPSLIKVLIDIDASNREQAKRRLAEFSSFVFAQSIQIQDGVHSGRSTDGSRPDDTTPTSRNDATNVGFE